MKKNNKILNTLTLATVCAGLLSVSAAVQALDSVTPIQTVPMTQAMPQDMQSTAATASMEKCYGVSKAGQNDCDAGMDPATCDKSVIDGDPNYWVFVPQGLCNKLVGGMTTPGMPSNTINTVPATPPSMLGIPSTSATPSTGIPTDPGMAPSTLPGAMPSTAQ